MSSVLIAEAGVEQAEMEQMMTSVTAASTPDPSTDHLVRLRSICGNETFWVCLQYLPSLPYSHVNVNRKMFNVAKIAYSHCVDHGNAVRRSTE